MSFDLNHVQVKYFDEDNEEVSVNSAEEYEELLKSAVKQGKQIQMNAYEIKLDKMENHSTKRTFENNELKGSQNKKIKKKEMKHSQLIKIIGPEMKVSQEIKRKVMPKDANQPKQNWQLPPVWFTEYMEMFKETFVRETVERICCDFFEKVNIQQRECDSSSDQTAYPIQVSEVHTTQINGYDWLMTCCNCQSRILGIRYQCSICPTYTICDSCEAGDYRHDPNHGLLKLRKAVASTEITPAQFGNSIPGAAEQTRLQKQIDKTFLKAEKQRLRAEKRQRKAEFKEIKKQLKLQKKHLQWNGVHVMELVSQPPQDSKGLKHASATPVMSTLNAEFVDENFPDGSHLRSGIKFIKHWRMKNTGNANWTSATKLQFMWGNLTLAFSAKKEVSVPFLQPGEIGVVSVEFVAPDFEGIYTSHWRLAHKGEQFGPRVWCSIVIDSPLSAEAPHMTSDMNANSLYGSKTRFTKNRDGVPLAAQTDDQPEPEEEFTEIKNTFRTADTGNDAVVLGGEAESAKTTTLPLPRLQHKVQRREFYTLPSVDLLTAQDLLSFELLDINIVQEMEHVPNNTPVDMTPCMSPLPYDGPLIERPGLVQIEEENEATFKSRLDHPHLEDGDEDISGTQFVCETVIRSLALDEAPDLLPRRRGKPDRAFQETQEISSTDISSSEWKTDESAMTTVIAMGQTKLCTEEAKEKDNIETNATDGINECFEEKYEMESQGSSDCSEDYIIILPECFDTSRPLGESMYSSALSQPEEMEEEEEEEEIEVVSDFEISESENAVCENKPQSHNINDILCISQTLEMELLKPEVVSAPLHQQRNDGATINSHELYPDVPEILEAENPPVNSPVLQQQNVSTILEVECAEVPRIMNNKPLQCPHLRHHSGIAGELVKGALSVAASAYKALFAGDANVVQAEAAENHTAPLMDILFEMGFCDRQLNMKLFKKHSNNLIEVVNELLVIYENDWYAGRH